MNQRIKGLDLLRGLAAISVLIFHFTTDYPRKFGWMHGHSSIVIPWGSMGVRIFFTLSGFVILMTIERSKTLADFAVTRFARIYPPYIFAAILTASFIFLTGYNPRHVALIDIPWNATMMATLLGHVSIDAPYWTLQREVLFYILVALMQLVAGKDRIIWAVLAWVCVSCLYNIFVAGPHFYDPGSASERWAVVINSQYCYLFVIGMTLYKMMQGDRSALVFVTFFLAVVSSGVSEYAVDHKFVAGSVVKAVGYAATLLAFASLPERWFKFKWLTFLGTISYSMYLVHETIGYGVIRQMQLEGCSPNVSLLVAVTTILLIAVCMQRWVEAPANNQIRRLWRMRTSPVSSRAGASPG